MAIETLTRILYNDITNLLHPSYVSIGSIFQDVESSFGVLHDSLNSLRTEAACRGAWKV